MKLHRSSGDLDLARSNIYRHRKEAYIIIDCGISIVNSRQLNEDLTDECNAQK